MTTPTHVEAWDTIPRGLDANDHSLSRGSMTQAERDAAERSVYLGRGLTQVTYVDTTATPAGPEA